ncbi:hypothetical protein KOW79_005212 [Hemibagrus wyckioides]|uniref:Uncharacterized protein n=1 Tax=Hemibagrus wyckioides TaxID=337641 RepID=A0A9D3P1J6_9TELE|nr:hypothetical protein KOW79_005212 [Hemibagrus wyckioides]
MLRILGCPPFGLNLNCSYSSLRSRAHTAQTDSAIYAETLHPAEGQSKKELQKDYLLLLLHLKNDVLVMPSWKCIPEAHLGS